MPQTAPTGLPETPVLRPIVASFRVAAHGRPEAFYFSEPSLESWLCRSTLWPRPPGSIFSLVKRVDNVLDSVLV